MFYQGSWRWLIYAATAATAAVVVVGIAGGCRVSSFFGMPAGFRVGLAVCCCCCCCLMLGIVMILLAVGTI